MFTSCILSFEAGQHEVVRRIVYKLKTDVVYSVNKKGQTTLHMAAAGGHTACVQLLGHYKKLVNSQDSFGERRFIDN